MSYRDIRDLISKLFETGECFQRSHVLRSGRNDVLTVPGIPGQVTDQCRIDRFGSARSGNQLVSGYLEYLRNIGKRLDVTLLGKLSESVKRARISEKKRVGKIAVNEVDDIRQGPGRRCIIKVNQMRLLNL